MANLGGSLILGDRPLSEYLTDLTVKLDSAEDRERLTACLAQYNAGMALSADDIGFVFDKAKQIALSF